MPAKPIFVASADLHLSDRIWANRPIEGDAYYALRQLVDYTLEHSMKAMVWAGDVFDRKENRSNPLAQLHRMLDPYHEAGGEVWYVQGQHEYDDPPWLSCHVCCHSLDRFTQELGGLAVAGLDYQPGTLLREALAEWPPGGTDVLVAHQLWHEFMGDKGEASFTDVSNAKALLTGDYHVRVQKKYGRLKVWSPGSTCLQAINEPVDKYFFVVHDDLSARCFPLRSRRLYSTSVAGPDGADALVAELPNILDGLWQQGLEMQLPEQLMTPLLRLTVSSACVGLEARVRRLLQDSRSTAHLFWEVLPVPRESAEKSRELRAKFANQGLRGMLPLVVNARKKPRLYRLCDQSLAELGRHSATEILARMKQEALAPEEKEEIDV